MTDERHWEKNNEDYLAAALVWLRLRLRRLGGPLDDYSGPQIESSPRSKVKLFGRRRRRHPTLALPPPSEDVTDEQVERAAADMAAAANVDPKPALEILAGRFSLSGFEKHVLLLCAAMELDTRLVALCTRAQPQPAPARPYPTFALALNLFDDPVWESLSPERPLRRWHFVEINQPAGEPLITSALRVDESIVNYLKGLNYLDDRLAPLMVPFDAVAAGISLPPSQMEAVAVLTQHVRRASESGFPPVMQVVGLDPVSKQQVAQLAAAELGLHLYRLPVESLPSGTGELETLARLWHRDGILLPVALYIDTDGGEASDRDGASGQISPMLRRFLARSRGVFFLGTREIRPGMGPSSHVVEVEKPTSAEQRAVWEVALDGVDPDSPALLAGQFNLNVASIHRIVAAATTTPRRNGQSAHDRVWEACLAATRPALDRLAQRLDPKATWNDIVLPDTDLDLLRKLADQVAQRTTVYDTWGFRRKMNRGFGINALFTGESGTGKTMAAEVIANHLRLNLYRIDLSAVVSKYIGETEKNLRRLFDAAEDGGAILFFDEADALFGKRSEVKDSHDRYANIEINYLLQRMESYNGLAILATNMKNALDHAFTRRLRFIVTFPFPGKREREAIWRKSWPAETPRDGLDYRHLARLNLTGGSITNVALNATFMAAQAGKPVTMPLVLDAARSEFRKLERPANESDFRWLEPEPAGV